MAIDVGTNSWVTEAVANTYMGDRLDADDYWVDGEANNPRALITAYKWLIYSGRFNFPDTATQKMKDGQCEYALYLLQHQPDIDLRMGLMAQGVNEAGIVKEKYDRSQRSIPIPPIVLGLLEDYDTESPFYMFEVERDEEEDVDYNAFGNLTD